MTRSCLLFFAATLVFCAAAPSARSQSAEVKPAKDVAREVSKPEAKKAKASYEEGLRAEQRLDWDAAFAAYSDAAKWDPNVREYLLRLAIAKSRIVQKKVDAAERDAVSGRLDAARGELLDASSIDPSNKTVQERIVELTADDPERIRQIGEPEITGEPNLAYKPGKQSFDYRGNTQGAYQQLASQFGVEAAFDVDLHARTVRFHVTDVDFPTAARLLGDMTATFWRPLTSRLFFVTDNTPQKRKDYDASVVRTILLPSSETPQQMTEMLRMVRDITGITRSDLDTSSHTITLRASPQAIAVASDLIGNLEQPTGEVVLEMEVLEVDRNLARQLGITPPQTSTIFSISSQQIQEAAQSAQGLIDVINQIFGSSSIPPVIAFGGGRTTFLATLPGAAANFGEMLSLVRQGRRILLRAQDGQPATFFVGDRIPVSLTTFAPSITSAGVSHSGAAAVAAPLTNYAAGNSPSFITTASLRGNSVNDLIVANAADNTISVLLGNGDGTFGAQTTFPTGTSPVSIATGQFNNGSTAANSDNILDLAIANKAANTVSILLGKGDGTFQPRVDIPTGRAPVSVIAADFHDSTGTGFTDLAVANQDDNSISIFQGNGDGTFQAPRLIQLPAGFAPAALAATDLNADGHADLVVADQGHNTISVFLGNGNGTFENRTDYPTGDAPVSVAFGDFNRDGAEDIAVANLNGNSVTVYYNQTSTTNSTPLGTFVAAATRDFAAGTGPTGISVADYNADGFPDIAVSDKGDNAITVLLNGGNELFGALPEIPVATAPSSIATADFNGDGLPDAATADSGSAQATVVINSASLFGSSGTGLNSFGTPYPGIQYLDIGLKVKATPRIHPNDDVTLELNFNISSLSNQSINAIPVISNDEVDQTVRLKPNETAALAGFLQTQLTDAITGNPGIAEIPGAGLLDQNQNAQQQGTELLILVTPRLVRLARRTDHTIYAGQGSVQGEGGGAAGNNFVPPPQQAPEPGPVPPTQFPQAGGPPQTDR